MAEKTMKSGVKFVITEAGFGDAHALLTALLAEAKGVQLGENPMDMDVSVLKDIAIGAVTSKAVNEAMWKCLQKASYDGVRVEPGLFDDPKIGSAARSDYFEMAWECIRVNCGPFFAGALSALKARKPSGQGQPAQ